MLNPCNINNKFHNLVHAWSICLWWNSSNLISLMHLIRSRASTNPSFFLQKTIFLHLCAIFSELPSSTSIVGFSGTTSKSYTYTQSFQTVVNKYILHLFGGAYASRIVNPNTLCGSDPVIENLCIQIRRVRSAFSLSTRIRPNQIKFCNDNNFF